jgi:hypothetical protein
MSPSHYFVTYNVTCIPTARQRLGKHIPAEAKASNNRTSIARQQISKHASLIIVAVFCVARANWLLRSVQQHRVIESSFETPACRDVDLGTEELNWVQLQNNSKNGIRRCKEDFVCVIWSDSETVINPLPGYGQWRLRILAPVYRWTVKCVDQL